MFVKWHRLRHPRDTGQQEIEGSLAMLANERRVAAGTHNQALSALLFLYREVLDIDLPWLDGVECPRTPKRIPSVLRVAEVVALLSALTDMALPVRLLYGTGMRLMEGLRLRTKNVDLTGCNRGTPVQGRQESVGDAAALPGRRSAQTGARSADTVGARPASAARWRGGPACTGGQVPRRGAPLGMVLSIPPSSLSVDLHWPRSRRGLFVRSYTFLHASLG